MQGNQTLFINKKIQRTLAIMWKLREKYLESRSINDKKNTISKKVNVVFFWHINAWLLIYNGVG